MGYASEQRRVTREVTFRLTDKETIAKAHKAADLRLARASILEEFARVKSTYKGRLEEKENELSTVLACIKDGSEKRVADVVDVFDFEQALVITLFSGEEVETRVMTAEERQLGFKFKTNYKDQAQLPLADKTATASPTALTDAQAEPWRVELPDPKEHPSGEVFVTGEPDRPTVVRFLAASWRIEAGESAMFRLRDEDVFGKTIKTWIREGAQAAEVPDFAKPQEDFNDPDAEEADESPADLETRLDEAMEDKEPSPG